ncbi:helix-turn-helix transcriptional regulator [Marinobacter hydrocarbonoclasticus]|nr:helix-turn-helix transcriptional regulator [Marinobacter nauticus]
MRWNGLARWTEQLMQVRQPQQLHQALKGLLPLLDADSLWLFVEDHEANQRYHFSAGLPASVHRFMVEHHDQDLYQKRYLSMGLEGECVPLQALLSDDPDLRSAFLTQFQTHFAFPHSVGVILPMGHGRKLGVSCHRQGTPFTRETEQTLSAIATTLLPWAQLWLGPATPCPCGLTLAETQVMNLLLQGLDGSEIAQRRKVSKETVKSQIKSLLHKTDCRHQNQLISEMHRRALQHKEQCPDLSNGEGVR